MTTNLNRRFFLALLAAGAAATTTRSARRNSVACSRGSIPPPHFPAEQRITPPGNPKTAAIVYLEL